MEIKYVCLEFEKASVDLADYLLQYHGGNAKAAIDALQREIEHLPHLLNLTVAAMDRCFVRGWVPSEGHNGV